MTPYIGTAGWSLPRDAQPHFPAAGTHLERYAGCCTAVEINSSFYRPHRPDTYERWAASVPSTFRFSVKLPRAITHEARLIGSGPLLDDFLPSPAALGATFGCLLIQLPPSLGFDRDMVNDFFGELCARYDGPIAVEPRHASWFGDDVDALLEAWRVARVAADPARVPDAAIPGGWPGMVYYRLHGSPRMYYSAYDDAYLDGIAAQLTAAPGEAWCIFDNTTLGAATGNALGVLERVR